ncbi:peptide deformylase [Youxingia wuxianensis]|uniref:Peptide deformylase n=1 Tax=Youxingia wuxianensis TaxID=2763678 RepID=A0A926II16_9FIRM|nr:peptide deformylase [Youxingia wuxianensis]MBC8585720.1 peptide deformylase [Youxingia wuxianensis]
MALRNVLKLGEETLRKRAREVTAFDKRLAQLLDDMYETMKDSDGVGLAAPQVGILRRAVVIDVGEGLHEMVNPVITFTDGDQYGAEGCLSVPGEYGMVHRPSRVTVEYDDRDGVHQTLQAQDYLAVAVCHELDHLDGVLFVDKADRMLDPDELEEPKEADQ